MMVRACMKGLPKFQADCTKVCIKPMDYNQSETTVDKIGLSVEDSWCWCVCDKQGAAKSEVDRDDEVDGVVWNKSATQR